MVEPKRGKTHTGRAEPRQTEASDDAAKSLYDIQFDKSEVVAARSA